MDYVKKRDGHHIDSCFCFYGTDMKENGMEYHIENFKQYTEV